MGQQHSKGVTVVLHKAPHTSDPTTVATFADAVAAAAAAFGMRADDVVFVSDAGQLVSDETSFAATFADVLGTHVPGTSPTHGTPGSPIDLSVLSRHEAEVACTPDGDVEVVDADTHVDREVSDLLTGAGLEDEVPLEQQTSVRFQPDDAATAAPAPLDVALQRPVDVLFVGAGPVGLWTAVQLKIIAPHLHVVMCEKHTEYQRKHVMMLLQASLRGRPTKHMSPEAQELDAFASALPKAVRTNVLEDGLTGMARRLGIVIVHLKVESLHDAVGRFKPRLVVGSDGSHSTVRDGMSHGGSSAKSVDKVIERTVNLKYEVHAQDTDRALAAKETYCVMKLVPHKHAFFEHVGKPNASEQRPATCVIGGLTEAQFDSVRASTFRNPFTLTNHFEDMAVEVQRSVLAWLAAKRTVTGERLVEGSETVSAVPLAVYRARWFAEVLPMATHEGTHTNVAVFLVGDAAFGVPFFRAINNGFVCGSRLASSIAHTLHTNDERVQLPEATLAGRLAQAAGAYHRFASLLATAEIARAMLRQQQLTDARRFARFASFLPQLVRLPKHAEVAVQKAAAHQPARAAAA